jgi:hypothetical protein
MITKLFIFFICCSALNLGYSYTNLSSCDSWISEGDLDIDRLIKLTNNINTTSSICLRSGVDNFTLDCQGFTLTGNSGSSGAGLYLDGGHSNVIVKNCNVDSFHRGVFIWAMTNLTLENIVINNSNNSGVFFHSNIFNSSFNNIKIFNSLLIGFEISGSGDLNLNNIESAYNGDGISIYSINNVINNGNFHNNDNSGIYMIDDYNTIIDSKSNYNSEYGLEFFVTSNNNSFDNNDFRNNNLGSIYISSNNVKNNLFTRNYFGDSDEIIASNSYLLNNLWNNSQYGNYYDDFNGTIPFCISNLAGCDYFAISSLTPSSSVSITSLPSFGFGAIVLALIGIVLFLF